MSSRETCVINRSICPDQPNNTVKTPAGVVSAITAYSCLNNVTKIGILQVSLQIRPDSD